MKRFVPFIALILIVSACSEDEVSPIADKKDYTFFVFPPPGTTSDATINWGVNALTDEDRIGRYDKITKKRIPHSGYGSNVRLAEGETFFIQVDEPGLVLKLSRNSENGVEEWQVTMALPANETVKILPQGK